MATSDLDVLIVGAGLSGIGAAYHLQTSCPDKRYAIFEGRERLGGTWDFFRYPGIRSDSDMYTLGFSFRPWDNPKSIADGPSILAYLRETAEAYGIDRHIQYRRRVERASWSSRDALWTVEARDGETGEIVRTTTRFLFACAGYYDYDAGYTPEFPGRDSFLGRVVHPQDWTDDIDYAGKRVLVIGSGATAVTLVPEIAKRAAHVTMLQRSPTYYIAAPDSDPLADLLRGRIPPAAAHGIVRWKNVMMGMAFFNACRRFPRLTRRLLVGGVKRHLRGAADLSHFQPTYDPWDQRLCLVPHGDLFDAFREGRASIVTDHVETFTPSGVRLKSGREIEADLIVTATGLKIKLFGGVALTVDGRPVDPKGLLTYKGLMFSDVPNLALALGYTNASWTLKCDLISQYVCRLIQHMDRHGYTTCCPRRVDPEIHEEPLLDFTSGYVQRALGEMPRQGSAAPWKLYQNYVLDTLLLRYGPVDDRAMEFSRA